MKKTLQLAILVTAMLVLLPQATRALFLVPQGGTGTGSFPQGSIIQGAGQNRLTGTYSPTLGSLTATSTTATTSLAGYVSLGTTTALSLNGVIVVDGVRFPRSGAGVNAALALCSMLGGGTVFAPSGTYLFSSQTVLQSNCNLQGAGTSTVFKVANNAQTNVLYGIDRHDIVLSDFQIDGNKTNQSYTPGGTNSSGIFLDSENATTTNILVTRIYEHDMINNGISVQRGMLGTPAGKVAVDGLTIKDSIWDNNGGAGLFAGAYGRGIQIDRGTSNVLVENNRLTNNLGVGLENGGGNYDNVYNQNLQVIGNYVFNNGVYGIDIGQQKGALVDSNFVDFASTTATSYGIFVESVAPSSRGINMTNNRVNNAGTYGIYVAGDNRYVNIKGNTVGAIINPNITGAFHIAVNTSANIDGNVINTEGDGSGVEGIGIIGVGPTIINGEIINNQVNGALRGIHVSNATGVLVANNTVASTSIVAGAAIYIDATATGTIIANNAILGIPTGAQNYIRDFGNNLAGSIFQGQNSSSSATFYLNQLIGIGTSSPATALDVNGLIRVYQTATTTCSASVEGSMFYHSGNKHFWGCDGTNWNRLDN